MLSNSFYWSEVDTPWAPPGYQLLSTATESWTGPDGQPIPILTGIANLFQDYAPIGEQTYLCPGHTRNDDQIYMWAVVGYDTNPPYAPRWARVIRDADAYNWQPIGDWIADRINLGLMVMAVWGPQSICNLKSSDGQDVGQYTLQAVDIPTFWSLQYQPYTYIVAVPSLYKFGREWVQSTYRHWMSSQIDGTETILMNWLPPATLASLAIPPIFSAPSPDDVSQDDKPPSGPTSKAGPWIFAGTILAGSLLGLAVIANRPR